MTHCFGLVACTSKSRCATVRKGTARARLTRRGSLGWRGRVQVGAPTTSEREAILRVHTARMPLCDDFDASALASLTFGRTCAELAAACREAALRALNDNEAAPRVGMRDFLGALGCGTDGD